MTGGGGKVLTIDRPEQLKALGHALRLRVLDELGQREEPLTNRELAERLGVDPGHLHFHVRMLLNAGLIERVPTEGGREKPYRAIAPNIRVAPELLGTGEARDAQRVMLEEVTLGYERYAAEGTWRSAQVTARLDPDNLRECVRAFYREVEQREDDSLEPLVVTVIAHPQVPASRLREAEAAPPS